MTSYFHGKKAFLQLYLSGARWTNDLSPVSLGQELIISNWCSAGFSPLTTQSMKESKSSTFPSLPQSLFDGARAFTKWGGLQWRPANRRWFPGKVIFHPAIFLLIVLNIFVTSSGLFGNVPLSETRRTTILHDIKTCFLSFSFNRLHVSQDCHHAAAEMARKLWRSVGFPIIQR